MIFAKDKLIDELREIGYSFENINVIKAEETIAAPVVELILKWLPYIYFEHLGAADVLVRSLMGAKEPFDPAILIKLFEDGQFNPSILSGIGYTLAYAKTTDISEWLTQELKSKEYSLGRSSLISGLPKKGGFVSPIDMIEFCKEIFDKYPTEDIVAIFKKYGNGDEIEFLEERKDQLEKWVQRVLDKVVKTMKKRLKIV